MGSRKFKLGCCHKNYERKRQLAGKLRAGRPLKAKQKKNRELDEPVVCRPE